MSVYTTQVRYICEVAAGYTESQPLSKVDEIITTAAPKVFLGNWPIFDEEYRLSLEKKILRSYYMEEIGLETTALWQFRLDSKLCEIMPLYNQLYKSELLEFNPLYDVDLTRQRMTNGTRKSESSGTGINTAKSTSTSSGSSSESETNKYSDTPQGGLTGLENDRYLTDARMVSNSGSNSNEGSGTTEAQNAQSSSESIENSDQYIEHVAGVNGGAAMSKRLQEFRETFLNIDKMIIEELQDLFMKVW